MPFVKVTRSQEEDAKGVKPIIVTFEKQAVSCLKCKMMCTNKTNNTFNLTPLYKPLVSVPLIIIPPQYNHTLLKHPNFTF